MIQILTNLRTPGKISRKVSFRNFFSEEFLYLGLGMSFQLLVEERFLEVISFKTSYTKIKSDINKSSQNTRQQIELSVISCTKDKKEIKTYLRDVN